MKVKELSGEVCVKKKCHLCCLETEMILTPEDIKRLSALGYSLEDFAKKSGKFWTLRNVDGKCYFLDDTGCRIYNHRPYGCRLYPLIYDLTNNTIVLDRYCPYSNEFRIEYGHILSLFEIIKIIKAAYLNKNDNIY